MLVPAQHLGEEPSEGELTPVDPGGKQWAHTVVGWTKEEKEKRKMSGLDPWYQLCCLPNSTTSANSADLPQPPPPCHCFCCCTCCLPIYQCSTQCTLTNLQALQFSLLVSLAFSQPINPNSNLNSITLTLRPASLLKAFPAA